MPLELQLLTSLAFALGIVYFATPVAIRVADQLEFYDRPVGYKGHLAPTPYLGGAAVTVAFTVVLLLFSQDWRRSAPLLAGVLVLWAVGTLDDRRTVTPALRVVVEVALATGLWALDLGWNLGGPPVLDLAVTTFWLVAVVNAFNFFDNMDGAASSMASVVAAGIAVLGVVQGDGWLTVAAAALCGACVGFLPHNLLASPARIFLGDGGSMPIGFAIGALVMIGTADSAAAWQSLAMGVLLVGVPALDTTLVIVSRLRQRIPILTGGRDHMTHRTLSRVRTARAVALVLGGAQALVSALALLSMGAGTGAVLFAVAFYVTAACVAIVVFDTHLRVAPPVPAEITGPRAARDRGTAGGRSRALLLVGVGALAGLSPFFFAYYSSAYWAPGGLALLAIAAAIAVARPVRPSGPQTLALAGLGGLGLLCLLSIGWSPAAEETIADGNRYLALAALLGVIVLLVRTHADGKVVLAALGAAGAVTAGVVLARLLAGDESLFLGGRLNAPLGYINGEAAFLGLLAWLYLAAAERSRPLLAGAGLAGMTLVVGLAVLAQSRGATLGAAVAVVAVMVLVPGRLHRLLLLAIAGVCLAPVVPWLLDVYQARTGGLDGVTEMRRAALGLALAAVVAGAVAAVLAGLPGLARAARPAVAGALALVAIVAAGFAIGNRDRLADAISRQADEFHSPGVVTDPAARPSRLATGSGNRYDYWRIALRTWRDEPVLGAGSGGYAVAYFRERSTEEDVRQPHSLPLQVLSELGLAGGALLALLLGAIAWGAARTLGAARRSRDAQLLAVAGIGAFTAWLVQTSVDWLHLLPGVTAVALCAAGPLLVPAGRVPRTASPSRGRVRLLPAVVVAVALIAAGVSLGHQVLAEHFLDEGRSALARDPARALREADRSLRIEPDATGAYRLKAAALARFGEAAAARAVLAESLRRRPSDWVTWALLGDLETRAGDRPAAARAYGRAVRLNPRDRGLRELREQARR